MQLVNILRTHTTVVAGRTLGGREELGKGDEVKTKSCYVGAGLRQPALAIVAAMRKAKETPLALVIVEAMASRCQCREPSYR